MARRVRQRAAVARLGKDLTRRSSGRCELCGARDRPFGFELAPFPEEPAMERALLACERCRGWLDGGDIDPVAAHHLSTAVWDERPAVKLAAARLLHRIDGADHPQTRDVFEAIGYDPESEELVEVVWEG
jgi:protein PhnA